jgi:hypothetical protein
LQICNSVQPDYVIIAESEDVYCKIYNKQIRCDRKSQIKQLHKKDIIENNKLIFTALNNDPQNEVGLSGRENNFYIDMYVPSYNENV